MRSRLGWTGRGTGRSKGCRWVHDCDLTGYCRGRHVTGSRRESCSFGLMTTASACQSERAKGFVAEHTAQIGWALLEPCGNATTDYTAKSGG